MLIELQKIEGITRCLNPDRVRHFADVLFRDGQTHPITVAKNRRGTYSVLDGGHRVEAARLLGWSAIESEIKPADPKLMNFDSPFLGLLISKEVSLNIIHGREVFKEYFV